MSIKLEKVTFTYNEGTAFETVAVDNVSLNIESGDIFGIMGKTGCGKSTLIQLMAGLLVPHSGSITIDEEDINKAGYDRLKLRSKLGMVFQYPETQLFETTAYKDVAFGLKYRKMSAEEKDANIRWALETMGFDPDAVGPRSPLELSGGEKRRLAIAGVLATRPSYLILDEPFAGLDPVKRNGFIDILSRLNREGMTIIIVSHNADALAECATKIALLRDGSVIKEGDIHDVWSDRESIDSAGIEVSGARRIAQKLSDRGFIQENTAVKYEDLLGILADRREV